jgi:hypothetical protein
MSSHGRWRRLHHGSVVLLLGLLTSCATPSHEVPGTGALPAPVRDEGARSQMPSPACPAVHYRLPVVSQVTVPTTIVGGVLIPAHRTYVVLQPGAWRVVEPAARQQPGAPTVPPACQRRLGAR